MSKFTEFFTGVIIVLMFIGYLLLSGCAKNASESAADSSFQQVNVIEHQIKKECPTAKIDESINALRASIKTQLLTCESEKNTLKERNNTLLAILVGILAIVGVLNWAKIKRIF